MILCVCMCASAYRCEMAFVCLRALAAMFACVRLCDALTCEHAFMYACLHAHLCLQLSMYARVFVLHACGIQTGFPRCRREFLMQFAHYSFECGE